MTTATDMIERIRARVIANEPVTKMELAEAIAAYRVERGAKVESSNAKAEARAKAKASIPLDLNDLFKKKEV